MKYISVCSGIEAATVAWEPLGFKAIAFSEIEPFCCELLKQRYPQTPNLGDINGFSGWEKTHQPEILVGGTPCQSFSIAGLRKGLEDTRGGIMLTYLAIARNYRPRWIVWENVPGVLSSNGGRDFGTFLGALGHLGYGFAYRVLDAQWFGLAQRRKRVFVVGCLGNWQSASKVLFKSESLCRNIKKGRKQGEEIANCIGASPSTSSCPNVGNGQGNVIPVSVDILNHSVSDVAHTLSSRNDMQTGSVLGNWPAPVAPTLNAHFGSKQGLENQHALGGAGLFVPSNDSVRVRRLTPIECERLQGFPDNYTAIEWKKKKSSECPDGPRYKALGNSMAVPVMRWIGERIKMNEQGLL